MSKVTKPTPQQLSQEEYDAKLEKNVNLMLDKGAPEQDVKAYVKDFSTRFSVKKKEESNSAPPQQNLGSNGLTGNTSLASPKIPKAQENVLKLQDQAAKEIQREYKQKGIQEYEISNEQIQNRVLEIENRDTNLKKEKAVESSKEEINWFTDLKNQLKSGTAETLAGLYGIPMFLEKMKTGIALSMMPDKYSEEFNKLSVDDRENLIKLMNPENKLGTIVGDDLQDHFTQIADKAAENTIKFEGNIVDDIANGNYNQAAYRVVQGATNSLPSLVVAGTPGGFVMLGAGSASQKQERLEREGESLDMKSLANSTVNGVVEGGFERVTAGMLKPLRQIALGNKEVAKEVSESLVKTVIKDFGKESASEAGTVVIQETADKLFKGEEISLINIAKNAADAAIIGGVMGGGTGATTGLAGYIANKRMTPEKKAKIIANTERASKFKEQSKNPNLDEEIKKSLENKATELESEANAIIDEEIKKAESMTEEDTKELVRIDGEISKEVKNLQKIEDSELDEDSKEDLIKDKKNQIQKLKEEKDKIVNKEVDEAETPTEETIIYHGTDNEFDKFDDNKISSKSGNNGFLGKGTYFTNNKDFASRWGKRIVAKKLDKNLKLYKHTKKQAEELGLDPNKSLLELTNYGEKTNYITELLKSNGYEGVYFKHNSNESEYMIFDPNSLENYKDNNENQTPTEETTQPEVEEATPETEVEPEEVNPSDSTPLETNTNETTPAENTQPDGEVQSTTSPSNPKQQNQDVPAPVEPTTSERKTEVVEPKITTKRIKSHKGAEYDVDFDNEGEVKSIRSAKTGKEIKKWRYDKKTGKPIGRNANYARIEADAYGTKTEGKINEEDLEKRMKALHEFIPSNPYEIALHALASGVAIDLEDASKETGASKSELKWASGNGFSKKGERLTVDQLAHALWEESDLDYDTYDIKNAIIDVLKEFSSVVNAQEQILEITDLETEKAFEEELRASMSNWTPEEFAIFEANRVDDEFIDQLTDEEAIEYFQDKLDEYEQGQQATIQQQEQEAITSRQAPSDSNEAQKGETEKETKPKELDEDNSDQDNDQDPDDDVQAMGFTGKKKPRNLSLSDGGPVLEQNRFQRVFKRFWNNTFKTNQGATKEVAETIRSKDREVSAFTDAISYEASRLKSITKSIKKKSKKKINERLRAVNDYLNGDKNADISFLNPNQIADLDALRYRIDSLSDQLNTKIEKQIEEAEKQLQKYKEGSLVHTAISESIARKQALIDTIKSNKGKYIYRSYEAFSNPKYLEALMSTRPNKEERRRIRNAVNYLMQNSSNLFGSQITEAEARKQIFEYLDSLKGNKDFITEVSNGKADDPFLKKRKDIPEPIRELLGEAKDPIYNYVNTTFKISNYIANLEYQDRLLEALKNTGLATYEGKEGYTKLVPDSEGWNTLHGIYVPIEMSESIADLQPLKTIEDGFYKSWVALSGLTKLGKTVLSPTTTARNVISGIFLGLNSGFFFMSNPKRTATAVSQAWGTAKSKTQLKAERQKLIKLGILLDGAVSGEIMETLNDFSKSIDRLVSKNPLEKTMEILQTAYAMGDDTYKVIGFYEYKNRYMKAGFTEVDAEAKAAERITNTFPTYSKIPRNIQKLRRIPVVGTFVSFPYEAIRTTKNGLDYIIEDIEAGRTKMAMQQAAGMMVASGTLFALSAFTRSMFGFDDEDDDKIRDMLPEWQKNSTLIYTGRENGKPTFIDGTAIFPAETYIKPLRVLFEQREGRDLKDKLKIATQELAAPYLGLDISFKTATDLLRNKDEYSRDIYEGENLIDGIVNNPDKITDYILKKAGPGVYNNFTEFMRANEINSEFFGDKYTSYGKEYTNQEALLALFGFRLSTINYASGMTGLGYEAKEKYNLERSEISQKLKSTRNIDDEKIQKLVNDYKKENEEINKGIMISIKGARKLGMTDIEIKKALKLSGYSQSDLRYLLRGVTPPLKDISRSSQKRTKTKLEINYKGQDDKKEIVVGNYQSNIRKFNAKVRKINRENRKALASENQGNNLVIFE
jgi:hypothetical protein